MNNSLIFEYFRMVREQAAILIIQRSAVSLLLSHLRRDFMQQKLRSSGITVHGDHEFRQCFHVFIVIMSAYLLNSTPRLWWTANGSASLLRSLCQNQSKTDLTHRYRSLNNSKPPAVLSIELFSVRSKGAVRPRNLSKTSEIHICLELGTKVSVSSRLHTKVYELAAN